MKKEFKDELRMMDYFNGYGKPIVIHRIIVIFDEVDENE